MLARLKAVTAFDVGAPPKLGSLLTMAAKVIVSVGVIWLILRSVDAQQLLHRIGQIKPAYLGLAVAIFVAEVPVMALRWSIVARSLRIGAPPVPLRLMVNLAYVGQFFGQVLPFLAGDGARIAFLKLHGQPLQAALSGVLVDRAVAVFVLGVIAIPSIFAAPLMFSDSRILLPLTIAPALIVLGTVMALAFSGLVARLLAPYRRLAVLGRILCDARAMAGRPAVALAVCGLSAVVHLMTVAGVYTIAKGQDLPLTIFDSAALVAPMLLVPLIPVALGGWGIREGVVAALLVAGGLSTEQGLILSISFGAVLMIAALPGLLSLAAMLAGTGKAAPETLPESGLPSYGRYSQ